MCRDHRQLWHAELKSSLVVGQYISYNGIRTAAPQGGRVKRNSTQLDK